MWVSIDSVSREQGTKESKDSDILLYLVDSTKSNDDLFSRGNTAQGQCCSDESHETCQIHHSDNIRRAKTRKTIERSEFGVKKQDPGDYLR
jgi:hypothetical protein